MNMREFLNQSTQEEREQLAVRVNSSVDYFWQLAGGHRKPGAKLARLLEIHSEGKLTAATLRPDYFGESLHG